MMKHTNLEGTGNIFKGCMFLFCGRCGKMNFSEIQGKATPYAIDPKKFNASIFEACVFQESPCKRCKPLVNLGK